MKQIIDNKNYIVVTHNRVYGIPNALRDFLVEEKMPDVMFIAHPLDKISGNSFVEIFKDNKKIKHFELPRSQKIGPLNFIFDTVLTFLWVAARFKKYDVFIGANNLNAFTGLILKKFGIVNRVIFYSMDFSLDRFKNRLLNKIYHGIEKYAIENSDDLWNVSPGIAYARQKYMQINPKKYPQKIIPTGVWNGIVKPLPFGKLKNHQLFFIGHLLEKQGVQIVLEAIPRIVKMMPNFKFIIVGSGEYKKNLEELTSRLNIGKYVKFTGIIQDHRKVHEIMRESACGIAPYKPENDKTKNFTYYGDPGKIKDYLNMGLPVILTDVPHNAKDLEKYGCAVIISYSKESVAKAIIKILKNKSNLKQYRKKAFKKAKDFDWHKIFKEVLY